MRIHYVSGLIMTVFIGLHLFNHLCALWGADMHLEVMALFRKVYRNRGIEFLLLGATLAQVISGLKLFRANRPGNLSGFERLSIYTGLYLAFFLVIHVGAVLAGRTWLELDTNFFFGVAGLNTFPYYFFFVPYYALAVLSVFGHLAAVHSKKMKRHLCGLTPGKQAKVILASSLVFTILVFYGLTNHFKGVEIPEHYRILAP